MISTSFIQYILFVFLEEMSLNIKYLSISAAYPFNVSRICILASNSDSFWLEVSEI